MLLAIAFLMFAVLIASWLVLPDSPAPRVETRPAEKRVPDSGTMPARA